MAFCTSCGARLDDAAKFCNQCGAPSGAPAPATNIEATPASAQPATTVATAPSAVQTAQTAPAKGGGSALKIILIVFVVIVGLFVLGGAVIGFGIWRFARATHIETGKDHASIKTPFGSVESNGNAIETMKKLGVDPYPGARALPGSAAVSFGGFSTAAAEFQTPDPPDRVEAFYKSRFPRSTVTANDEDGQDMVFTTNKGMITIRLTARGSGTHIAISNVAGMNKPTGDSESR